jgi:Icc-related predicted phosphoesterase
VRDFIEQRQPEFFYCGHIHEAAGVEDSIGRTRGWNVGKRGSIFSSKDEPEKRPGGGRE